MPKTSSISVTIKRFDSSLPLPEYKTKGAAAFDLYAREDTIIQPGKVTLVPLNVAFQIPDDHWILMAARSSLHKRGVMMANGIGVGDYDFRGDGDEYHAALLNFTDQPVMIERAERIVQMIVMHREPVVLNEVSEFGHQDRGGFGSTGRS
jgi:dUTP pyrophosphatase